MDPLQLLREFVSAKRPIVEQEDGVLVFGEWRVHKSVPTKCRGRSGKPYTLADLHFLATHAHLDAGKLTLTARDKKVVLVTINERKDIINYLTGSSSVCAYIDLSAVVPLAEREGAKRAGESLEADGAKEARGEGDGPDGGLGSLSQEKILELREKRKAAKLARVENEFESAHSADVATILLRERVYEDRNSVLRGRGRLPLTSVLTLVQKAKKAESTPAPSTRTQDYDRYNQKGRSEGGGFAIDQYGTFLQSSSKPAPRPVPAARPPSQDPKAAAKPRQAQTPIILVPASTKALLTLYNARAFLEEGKFETATEVMQRGEVKPRDEIIHRRFGGRSVPYKIMDGTTPLSPEQWDRVIAVFVAGPAWQFKDFPWGGKPVDILTHIKGFHLKFTDDKLDPNVHAWDVTVLQIDRSQRFKDAAALHAFWQALDAFVTRCRPAYAVSAALQK